LFRDVFSKNAPCDYCSDQVLLGCARFAKVEFLHYVQSVLFDNGPVWIHGLELVLASWSSTSHKVSKHEG
jgi:hypothetical protein